MPTTHPHSDQQESNEELHREMLGEGLKIPGVADVIKVYESVRPQLDVAVHAKSTTTVGYSTGGNVP